MAVSQADLTRIKAQINAADQTMQNSAAGSTEYESAKTLKTQLLLLYSQIYAEVNAAKTNTAAIDSTPKTATTPVNSGSGQKSSTAASVNAEAVAAGDFAYGDLGNGTAGGMGNAALYTTTTILPNTKKTQISRDQLEAADKAYTAEMNKLSNFWATQDTSSPEYEAQKQAAMTSQYNWELARNDLEEVATSESARDSSGDAPIVISQETEIDLSGVNNELSPVPSLTEDENEIVVTARPAKDQRIRIRPLVGQEDNIYGTDAAAILHVLRATDGVFFPYTPTVDYSHRAEYSTMAPTHANTSYFTYNHTPAVQITISGQFSAQNQAEAQYTLAAMHFFRTVTKMHFGTEEAEAGTAGLPPPVLELSGYGEFMFNALNVVIQEFKMDLPSNVDYIEIEVDGIAAWVPTLTTFTVSCVVQQTPRKQRDEFNFNDFASGKLFTTGKGWI